MDSNLQPESLKSLLRLLATPRVGVRMARLLMAYCGSAQAVFDAQPKELLRIPGVGQQLVAQLQNPPPEARIQRELHFIERHGIRALPYGHQAYPRRLADLEDAPMVLFVKGELDLNAHRILGVVGTRKPTDYGRRYTEELVKALAPYQPVILSGLAYGIDHLAHTAALACGLPTAAVLAHGLDTLYPAPHQGAARKIVQQGGALITEYVSGTAPDRPHFPERNRIVAGMLDGLLIIESGEAGGALITAHIADSYNRDVLALPGRALDKASAGCNRLIKQHKALMVETAEDIAFHLGWDKQDPDREAALKQVVDQLPESERRVVHYLRQHGKCHWDGLVDFLGTPPSELAMQLLNLEFQGLVDSLPGKYYALKGRF